MNTKARGVFSRISFGLLSVFTALSVAFAVLPQTASAAAAVTCAANYTVKSGDTLSMISRRYDMGLRTLAAANNLATNSMLTAGTRLCIPDESTFSLPPVGVGNLGMTAPTQFSFATSASGNHINLNLTNVKSSLSFKARVQDASATTNTWYSLGTVNGTLDNTTAKTFMMPTDIKSAASLRVCLKNMRDGSLYCEVIAHTS